VTFDIKEMKLNFAAADLTRQRQVMLAGSQPEIRKFASTGMSRIPGFSLPSIRRADPYLEHGNRQLLRASRSRRHPQRRAFVAVNTCRIGGARLLRAFFMTAPTCERPGCHIDFVSGLAFSPDGERWQRQCGRTIRLWTWPAETIASWRHMEEATDVAFSPDGQTLASVGPMNRALVHVPRGRNGSETMTNAGMWLQFSPDAESCGNHGRRHVRCWKRLQNDPGRPLNPRCRLIEARTIRRQTADWPPSKNPSP